MKEIPLTKGYFATVDDEDYERLAKYTWNVQVTPKKNATMYYACRTVSNDRGGWKKEWMHRVVTSAPEGLLVDHIDRNGLNNTRANLRLCTASQNLANREMRRAASYSTQYQGVLYLDPENPRHKGNRKRYKAYTSYQGVMRQLGTYATAEEAAQVRDRAALHYHGEFANLNFPERLEEYKADPYVPREPKRYKPRAPKQSA